MQKARLESNRLKSEGVYVGMQESQFQFPYPNIHNCKYVRVISDCIVAVTTVQQLSKEHLKLT